MKTVAEFLYVDSQKRLAEVERALYLGAADVRRKNGEIHKAWISFRDGTSASVEFFRDAGNLHSRVRASEFAYFAQATDEEVRG